MGWGQLLGAAAGFVIGGPAGASLGASLGGAAEEVTGGGATGAAQQATAQTQAATNEATALQREMFQAQQAQQAPFREGGLAAQNRLMTLLGIRPPIAPASGGGGGGGGGFGMLGGVADAIRSSGAIPGTGPSGLSVDPNSPDYGKYARDFGAADFQTDPGYAFRLSEGQKALDRSAAARGGLISGGALKAATRFGQDMGSQEYQNAFNRYQTNRSNQLNPLQSLMGAGQSATNTLGAAGQQYGQNVGNAMINQGYTTGNALLAGQQAQSSAYGQLGSVLGKYLGGGSFGGGGSIGSVGNTAGYYDTSGAQF